jgi:hypothetical protein
MLYSIGKIVDGKKYYLFRTHNGRYKLFCDDPSGCFTFNNEDTAYNFLMHNHDYFDDKNHELTVLPIEEGELFIY